MCKDERIVKIVNSVLCDIKCLSLLITPISRADYGLNRDRLDKNVTFDTVTQKCSSKIGVNFLCKKCILRNHGNTKNLSQ